MTTPANKAYLRELPPEIRFMAEGKRFRLVHGSPRRMNEYLFEDRDPRAAWTLFTIAEGKPVEVEIRHVPYDVAAMAAAIRAADGLPDHFARDLESGG